MCEGVIYIQYHNKTSARIRAMHTDLSIMYSSIMYSDNKLSLMYKLIIIVISTYVNCLLKGVQVMAEHCHVLH